ncbi:MAG: tripartite tricarboxylate transporter substrate binding protein [Xanthobacteraceae bacterium]
MTTRRAFLTSLAATALFARSSGRALAEEWPDRPVKILVPFAAGGNTDGIARLIGQYLSTALGQPFVVENRPGAGGVVAASTLARATADGYTLMVAALPQIAILPVLDTVDYDPLTDFTAISNLVSNPFCLVANPQFEPKTLKEFVSYVTARPGQVPYASGGAGSLSHLAMVLLCDRAGLNMIHVPYKGGGPAIEDVIANQVPVYFANLSEAIPHVGKELRAYAVSAAKRTALLPDVPTVAESGYSNFRAETWNGLIAPAKTAPSVVDLIARQAQNALKDQTFLERLDVYGVEPVASTPAEFKRTIQDDVVQWRNTIKQANIKL